MALRETQITGIHADIDGTPITNAYISFKPKSPLGFSSTHTIPDKEVKIQTNNTTGAYSATLWAEETDALVPIEYQAKFPTDNNGQPQDDYAADFDLPYSSTPLSLPVLLAKKVNENKGAARPDGLKLYVEKTDDYTVAPADLNKTFINPEAADVVTYKLSADSLAAGLTTFRFFNTNQVHGIRIEIPAGAQAFVSLTGGGGLLNAGDFLTSDALGGEYAECDFLGLISDIPTFLIRAVGNWT